MRAEEETHNSDPLNLARARNSHGAAVTRLCIRVVRLAQRWKGHRCPLVKALKAWQAPLRLAEHSYSGVGMPTRRCTRREGTSRLPLRLSDDKEEPSAQSRPYSSIPSPLFTRVQQRCAQACGRAVLQCNCATCSAARAAGDGGGILVQKVHSLAADEPLGAQRSRTAAAVVRRGRLDACARVRHARGVRRARRGARAGVRRAHGPAAAAAARLRRRGCFLLVSGEKSSRDLTEYRADNRASGRTSPHSPQEATAASQWTGWARA